RMAAQANVNLDISVVKEACPHNLAPTSSTTATLALGDTLAVCLLKLRGFTADDFARSHPGGKLGRRLLLRVNDVMHSDDEIPTVLADTLLKNALLEISRKGLGFAAVVDNTNQVIGVYTDGDLRRSFEQTIDVHNTPIQQVMTSPCLTIRETELAVEALNLMDSKSINALPVVDQNQKLVGAVNMHDLLRAGVV
ncbi:unnamed protein product, partial [Cyprideis torosa]